MVGPGEGGETGGGRTATVARSRLERGQGVKATLDTRAPTDTRGQEATGADQRQTHRYSAIRNQGKVPNQQPAKGVPAPSFQCADTVSADLGHRAISQTVRKQSSANRPPEVPSSSRVLARTRPLQPLSSGQCGWLSKQPGGSAPRPEVERWCRCLRCRPFNPEAFNGRVG